MFDIALLFTATSSSTLALYNLADTVVLLSDIVNALLYVVQLPDPNLYCITYPDGIFKGIVKGLLYTLIPVGITTYIPVKILSNFNLQSFILVILVSLIT